MRYAITPNAAPAMMTGPIASPSSPSVRFTAFEAPTMTRIANGIQNQPRFTSQPLKNGIARTGSQALGGCQKISCSTAKATTSCAMNFTRVGSPLRVRSLVTSSQIPMSPKPPVARITTQMIPPIVGVPFLVRCRSGVSSRIVSPPCCAIRSRRMIHGPTTSEMMNAEIRAMNDRKVR